MTNILSSFRRFCLCGLFVLLAVSALPAQIDSARRGAPVTEAANSTGALPDAPQPQVVKAKYWTFRGVYRDANGHKKFNANAPALPVSKKMWAEFAVLHGGMFAAWAVSNHNVETPGSEIPAMAAVTGADVLMLKFLTPMMAIEAPVYGIQHYLRNR